VLACVVDEEPAHDLTRHPVEMRAAPPVDPSLVDQFQVGLVNQCGGLEGMVGAFAPQLAGGDAAQFVIDERQQSVERARITSRPVVEQPGEVAGRSHQVIGYTLSGHKDRPCDPRQPLLYAISYKGRSLCGTRIDG
jgi:hypothetical protein